MRRPFALLLAAALVACADDAAGPAPHEVPASTVAGRWAAVSLDGRALPALVNAGTEPAGWSWTVHVLWDSLVVTDDGRWVHRARWEERNSLGEVYPQQGYDRGTWTRTGDSLDFVSSYIENVRFAGRVAAPGELQVDVNVLLDDALQPMRLVMRR